MLVDVLHPVYRVRATTGSLLAPLITGQQNTFAGVNSNTYPDTDNGARQCRNYIEYAPDFNILHTVDVRESSGEVGIHKVNGQTDYHQHQPGSGTPAEITGHVSLRVTIHH
jgi:hypothetical protein